MKDICRVEAFREHVPGYREGYAIWLTNDPYYWSKPKNDTAGYSAFSVHNGAVKEGTMSWGVSMNEGSIKGRAHSFSPAATLSTGMTTARSMPKTASSCTR